MDAERCQIPIVHVDTVGGHLFFSAVPKNTEGGGWIGRRESWEAPTVSRRQLFRERDCERM